MLLLLATGLAGCTSSSDPLHLAHGPVGRIDGAVLDHVLFPYGNVTVRLVELDVTTRTTELGGFSFVHVDPGFYTVEVVLAGIGSDRELVFVEGDQTTRVILQVIAPRPDRNYVAELSWTGTDTLGEPGADCQNCDWRAGLRERRPDMVVAAAVWPVDSTFDTHMTMEVRTPDGKLLLGPLGAEDAIIEQIDGQAMRHLGGIIEGEDIPEDAGNLLYHFTFSNDNLLPHVDFRMESFLWVHYGIPDPLENAEPYL